MRQEYNGTYLNKQIPRGYEFAHQLAMNGWTVKVDSSFEGNYNKDKKIVIQAFIEDHDEEPKEKQLLMED